MERQNLHDLVATGRGGRQLQLDAIGAGRQFTRTRKHFVDGAMVGQALAQKARLCDIRTLGIALQRQIGLRVVMAVAVLVERDQRNDSTHGVYFGRVEVGADRDRLAFGRGVDLSRDGPRGWHRTRRGIGGRYRQILGGRRSLPAARRDLCRGRREWRVGFLPFSPQEKDRKRKDDEQDDALGIHGNSSECGSGRSASTRQGTGS